MHSQSSLRQPRFLSVPEPFKTISTSRGIGLSQDYVPGRPAEGIVIRPFEEARSLILESGRLSAKVISERYSLKHGE